MFQYNISDKFLNNDINYPFNIMDKDDNPIEDFWTKISNVKDLLLNDNSSKVRFIWIESEGYCQAEVFIRRILQEHPEYPVLYLHWMDYFAKHEETENPITIEINKVYKNGKYFADDPSVKICVIDHAEKICKLECYTKLCESFNNKSCIFIFLSKRTEGINYDFWIRLLKCAKEGDGNIGLIRSEDNFFKVERYSVETCKNLISSLTINENIKIKSLEKIETLNAELRRVYYFDLFLMYLKTCSSTQDIPNSFNDTDLLGKIYINATDGIISHLKSSLTLEEFINNYYLSDIVKNGQLDKQKREPIDDYVWAYGIIKYTPKNEVDNYYQRTIKYLFDFNKEGINVASPDQIRNITNRIISISVNNETNCFSLESYLVQLANYSLRGSWISARVLNDSIENIEKNVVENLFLVLCNKYKKQLSNEKEINSLILLGMEIGKIIPNIPNEIIEKGLNCFFKNVTDDYVCPVYNCDGISAIPVTNFEFLKFVNDGGYRRYYDNEIDMPLEMIATKYYREIFDFIIESLEGNGLKDSKFLASILKGYDWLQYKQIAYLFALKDSINIEDIYKSIQQENYPHPISHPAKWIDDANTNTNKPFCNPLQPVVCVNIFEARAYAKWLSKKIEKHVRIVKYDPDYISIIGAIENGSANSQRVYFLNHLQQNQKFINTAENRKWFYGSDDIEIREPTPIAIPNSIFSGIYDFLGNIFEIQDTKFNYKYSTLLSENAIKIFEKKEETLIDYNCPGGGLQRTKLNLPPEYMGQVPAFLRNQDIGFRIVIDGNSEKGILYENQSHKYIHYTDSDKIIYRKVKNQDFTNNIFKNIIIKCVNSSVNNENTYLQKKSIYVKDEKSVVLFSQNNNLNKLYEEFIMLTYDGKNIFVYQLLQIASYKTYNADQKLSMVVRHPKVPNNLSWRKKCDSKCLADWIDVLKIYREFSTETYFVYSLSVANGYFNILPRKVRKDVIDGNERKKISSLVGSYKISFCEDKMNFKNTYFDNLKTKLSTEFFLPDWIDIVEFIKYIASSITNTQKPDIDTVMAAITTIDTSDLHEKINEKIVKGEFENE